MPAIAISNNSTPPRSKPHNTLAVCHTQKLRLQHLVSRTSDHWTESQAWPAHTGRETEFVATNPDRGRGPLIQGWKLKWFSAGSLLNALLPSLCSE